MQPELAHPTHRGVSQSRYFELHAFNKKRTLADGFFNEKQVTKANHKQFVSQRRAPHSLNRDKPEAGVVSGRHSAVKEDLLRSSLVSIKAPALKQYQGPPTLEHTPSRNKHQELHIQEKLM